MNFTNDEVRWLAVSAFGSRLLTTVELQDIDSLLKWHIGLQTFVWGILFPIGELYSSHLGLSLTGVGCQA